MGHKNAPGVTDKVLQTLKQILARLMAEQGSDKNWLNYLKKATVAYNSNYHSTVHAAPQGCEQGRERSIHENAGQRTQDSA